MAKSKTKKPSKLNMRKAGIGLMVLGALLLIIGGALYGSIPDMSSLPAPTDMEGLAEYMKQLDPTGTVVKFQTSQVFFAFGTIFLIIGFILAVLSAPLP